MDIHKALVPIDFSEFSEKALKFALDLGKKYKSHLTLLHVVVLFHDDINEEERLQEYESLVKSRETRINTQMRLSEQQVKENGIRVDTAIVRGITASDAILEFITENTYDIIIMGTHGRSGLKHIFQGSVAEKVVRLSPIPVLSIHRSFQKFNLKKLLVPLDFSTHSKKATDFAISLAKKFQAQIDFLHVIEQDIHPSYYASGAESIFEIDTGLKDRVKDNMQGFLADQLNPEYKVSFHVNEGKAHKSIIEFANDQKSDMIIIATHGLTGVDYILLGSTTEKVVRWANCPVLTVK